MKGGVRKRGKKWYCYFKLAIVEGKRKKIERVGGDTKKEAQPALRIALNEYEDCGNVFDENNISVSDFLDFWYKEYVMLNCKFQTQNNYKRAIENHIKPNLGKYRLKLITPMIIQKFLNDKSKENYSSGTIRVIKGVLNNSFKMAVHPYRFIKENPMLYVKIPRYFDSDWVCTKKNGSQITLHNLKNMSRTINRELGIDFNFHSLRHTHATMLLEAGANIKDIQKRLGHNKIATTMDTYSHVTDKMKTETVNIFEGIIK
ncbi:MULTISPECIES: site-specific integrase [unclassified Clostridioides]|uniref:tyrosine-type recombinase/integrase n=1 Tax=unclassified Clostridioides TaxID=2635829 RepID=UPI001D0FF775|nr:tyrosine-type recombinase/integrase [Clostridioides sp. ES-S-0049-02]MCC0707698.1 tyrosine-type recombinase/integrase [Clostridioides sp. ES-S-0190-01]